MEVENDDEEKAVAAILLACALQTPGKPGFATSLSLVITRHRGETGRHHKT